MAEIQIIKHTKDDTQFPCILRRLLLGLSFASIACASIILPACATGSLERPAPGVSIDPKFTSADFSSFGAIAVLDLHDGNEIKLSGEVDICKLGGLSLVEGHVKSGAGEVVADHIHAIMDKAGYPMADRVLSQTAQATFLEKHPKRYGVAMATMTAADIGADAVIMGCVARFEDLSGARLSADKPAYVSYGIIVWDVQEERVAWAGKFTLKQKSLFEDLIQWRIFIDGGMVWQTADSLSGVGARYLIENMPRPAHKQD